MATVKMSKDGQTFFQVDDSPESQDAASAKGYQPYMDVTKDGQQVHTIIATPDSVKAATDKGYVSTQAMTHRQAMAPSKQATIGGLEAGARGVADYNSAGFTDELTGAVGAVKDLGNGQSFGDNYAANRDFARQQSAAAQDQHPALYHAAGLVSSIANPIAKVNSVGGAAALGAVGGLGNGQGDAQSQVLSTLVGGGIGAVGGAIANKLTPDGLTDTANKATLKALGAGKGELRRLGPDGAAELAQGVRDNGILAVGTDAMLGNAQAVKAKAGQAMGQVFDQVDQAGASTFNPQNVAKKFSDEFAPAMRDPLNRDVASTFDNVVESIAMRGSQSLPLKEAQSLKQVIGNVAYPGGKAPLSPTDKQQMAMDAYRAVSKAIDEAAGEGADKIGTSGLKETLQAAKKQYGNATTAEGILEGKLAGEQSRKSVGLTDWITAAAHSNPVTGAAAVVVKKVAEKVGPATIAGSADWLAKTVANNPNSLGKFAPVLRSAASRGGASLAATHYLLQQSSPEYRETVKLNEQDP